MKTPLSKEAEQNLKNKSVLILNCFGYVNLKLQDINIVDFSNYSGFYEFILVEFENKKVQLTFKDDSETKSWNLLDRTEDMDSITPREE